MFTTVKLKDIRYPIYSEQVSLYKNIKMRKLKIKFHTAERTEFVSQTL